jgi:hypothetical protein
MSKKPVRDLIASLQYWAEHYQVPTHARNRMLEAAERLRELLPQDEPVIKHGTPGGYKQCGPPKCDVCKDFRKRYMQEYRSKQS